MKQSNAFLAAILIGVANAIIYGIIISRYLDLVGGILLGILIGLGVALLAFIALKQSPKEKKKKPGTKKDSLKKHLAKFYGI